MQAFVGSFSCGDGQVWGTYRRRLNPRDAPRIRRIRSAATRSEKALWPTCSSMSTCIVLSASSREATMRPGRGRPAPPSSSSECGSRSAVWGLEILLGHGLWDRCRWPSMRSAGVLVRRSTVEGHQRPTDSVDRWGAGQKSLPLDRSGGETRLEGCDAALRHEHVSRAPFAVLGSDEERDRRMDRSRSKSLDDRLRMEVLFRYQYEDSRAAESCLGDSIPEVLQGTEPLDCQSVSGIRQWRASAELSSENLEDFRAEGSTPRSQPRESHQA